MIESTVVIEKQDLQAKIKTLERLAMNLSLNYADDLLNKVADKEDLKYLNEIKKHLNFAKKLYKELFPNEDDKNSKPVSLDVINEIKKINSSLGEIVRQIPT